MSTVAIMQPTLMPWLGYFALMDSADYFVYLDDVQFSKQSWQSRNRIKSQQGELLLSIQVCRKSYGSDIKEVRIASSHDHKRFMKSVSANLSKAPYFELTQSILADAYQQAGDSLCALNIGIIEQVAEICGITTSRLSASEIGVKKTEKTIRLINICRHFEASCYLSPVGSLDYLEASNSFENSSIELLFQNFEHPVYPQAYGTFMPCMAVVDALSWVGPDKLLSLIRSGKKPHLTKIQLNEKLEESR